MSSIDKYVEDYAKNIDRRVQVTNANGMITGRINGRIVFSVPDRYGYLNDSEKASVSRQMNQFFSQERAAREAEERRRREEEERRRREEEERRRILEEQRQSAIREGTRRLNTKKAEIEAEFEELKMEKAEKVSVNSNVSNSFNVSPLINNLNDELENIVTKTNKDIERAKESLIQSIESTIRTLKSGQNATAVNNMVQSKMNLHASFDKKSATKEISEVKTKLKSLEKECNAIYAEVKKFTTKYNNSVTKMLETRIKNIQIDKVSDFNKITALLNDSIGYIEQENERQEMLNSIKEFAKASDELSTVKLASNVEIGNVYDINLFESEIANKKQILMSIKESLQLAPYTTMNADLLSSITSSIENSDLGEEKLTQINRLIDMVSEVKVKDERLKPNYNSFLKAREDALSYGLEVENTFDPTDPDSQLDRIIDSIVQKELENERELQMSRLVSTKVLMESLGYNLIGIEEAGSMKSMVFARSDLKDVVMQVDVTTEGIRRTLIGVKTNGQQTSNEAIKAAARVLESLDEPNNFMAGYNTIYPDALVGEDFGFADDPNIDEVINRNSVYDLDEANKTEIFKQITGTTETYAETVKASYIPARSVTVKASVKAEAKKYEKKRAQKLKARYQTL